VVDGRLGYLEPTLRRDRRPDACSDVAVPATVGTPERSTLDLNALGAAGVAIVGRLAAVRDGRALFSGDFGTSLHWLT